MRSLILVCSGGMLYCRRGILRFTESLLRLTYMEVRMLYRYRFTSSLYEIHLNISMMPCLGIVLIYWVIYFSNILREGGKMSEILLGEGNLESTNTQCIMLRRGLGESDSISSGKKHSPPSADIQK